jgi:hypothetical protein
VAKCKPRARSNGAAVRNLVEPVKKLQDPDLNPLKALPPGAGTIAIDSRMRIGEWEEGQARRVDLELYH